MTSSVERVLQVVQHLSPTEQLELIQAISQSLLHQYHQSEANAIPHSIKRTLPATDLAQLAADFWPEEETADDINNYVAQQRREDRLRDL
jgi:predicted membrane chloride channel (bestrophin family)